MKDLNEMQNLNYEQKKNNGKGVFYGVIAVATLIVAIIGATFAYFTASANSSDNALSATAAHVEVNYLEGRQLVATNLIPSSAEVVAAAYARPTAYETNVANGCSHKTDSNSAEANPESTTAATNWENCEQGKSAVSTGDVGTKCVDDNGYYVCAVYQFTVTNTSNVKQALQAYMTINTNEFTTVDNAAATNQETLAADHSNGALKFMTVRSGNLIDVTAISSVSNASTCQNNLVFEPTQSVQSTRFCTAAGADDANKETFTDTSGNYYYFNTTAIRQSLHGDGTQVVFSGEILPSISAASLTSSNGILYMHTVSQGANNVTSVGPSDNPTAVGTVYADSNGYTYDSEALCLAGKTFNATCHQVYLSSSNQPSGTGDAVVGAYGQVSRTYYIVAWLEENNPNNTLNFYGGNDGEGNYTGTLTQKAEARGRTTADKLDQDDDQDARFATTINVTSGSLGSAGITGTINSQQQQQNP